MKFLHEKTSNVNCLWHNGIITCQKAHFALLVVQKRPLLLTGYVKNALEKEI